MGCLFIAIYRNFLKQKILNILLVLNFTSANLIHFTMSDKLTKDQSVASNKKAVHPKGRFLQKWNKAFMLAYILSVSLDPLFFYIPVIDNNNKCLDLDKTLKITACVLRSVTDLFYVFNIIFKFRTGFIAPSSRVYERGEFIEDSTAIAKRYLSSYFMIDVITVLPLPQIVILIIAPNVNGPIALVTKEMLKIVIFAQYVPRFCRIIPLYKEVERTSIFFNNESAWGGTAFYIFLFMWSSNVPIFEEMDEQLLDALADRLKPALFTQKSFIMQEGDPVEEMHFLMRGTLSSMTTNGERTGFFNSVHLKAGDFYGDELLTWALDPHTSSSSLPISTRKVQAVTDIEVFAITADDLKFVASQFRRLHSKQLQHTYKFFSQEWRTWAACFIQVAWRRHCRKTLEKSLREEEDKVQVALAKGRTNASSLGATIYASRFAAKVLRSLRCNNTTGAKSSPTLPLLLHKPAEPDFSEKK